VLCYNNAEGMAYFRSFAFMTDAKTPTQSLFNMRFMWVFSIEAVQVLISCFTCFQACSAYEMDTVMRNHNARQCFLQSTLL
jgi:hypothetical protein